MGAAAGKWLVLRSFAPMATPFARPRTLSANPLRRLAAVRARATASARARELWPVVRAAAARAGLSLEDGGFEQVAGDRSVGVVVIRSVSGSRTVLRFASRPDAIEGLARADAALAQVRAADPALAGLVPEIVLDGTTGPVAWRLETCLEGQPATAFTDRPGTRPVLIGRIAAVLGRLRDAVTTERPLTSAEVAGWVERDRQLVVRLGVDDVRLEAVAEALDGVTTPVGLIHGDLWAGNVLVDPADLEISGIVDWDSAANGEPAFHDLLHLLLTARRRANRQPLGEAVIRALDRPDWEAWEQRLLEQVGLGGASLSADRAAGVTRAAVSLYWLREIRSNLARHPSLAGDRTWVRDNVSRVGRWV